MPIILKWQILFDKEKQKTMEIRKKLEKPQNEEWRFNMKTNKMNKNFNE